MLLERSEKIIHASESQSCIESHPSSFASKAPFAIHNLPKPSAKMPTHLAAISHAKGAPLTIQPRQTPKPGAGELLIAVKSIALNPADIAMRETGLFITSYPAILGFDVAGLVVDVGQDVPVAPNDDSTAAGLFFQPGKTRIAAYAASVWKSCGMDYGAFQEMCLVPWQHAVPIPHDEAGVSISWNEAATIPVAVQVPLSAWDALGVLRGGESSISALATIGTSGRMRDERNKGEALLIWGASSSVGSMGVQTARVLRDDPGSDFAAVYATAGVASHEYVKSLGADRVFDYKDSNVVDEIISAARDDGLVIRHCFLATGHPAACQSVLKAFVDDVPNENTTEKMGKIASAPVIPPDAKDVDGVEIIFVMPSFEDETVRLAQFEYWLGTWCREHLAGGKIRPSPEVRVVGRGLDAINAGLDQLAQGVSCAKLVVEVAE
jgi:NADPH:quinone reductase-like Zn-dependent oxidoreductase